MNSLQVALVIGSGKLQPYSHTKTTLFAQSLIDSGHWLGVAEPSLYIPQCNDFKLSLREVQRVAIIDYLIGQNGKERLSLTKMMNRERHSIPFSKSIDNLSEVTGQTLEANDMSKMRL